MGKTAHKLICIGFLALLCGWSAMAQTNLMNEPRIDRSRDLEQYGPRGQEWEVTLGGGGSNNKRFEVGGFGLNGSIGYFLTDKWEIALRQSFAWSDFGDSSWNGSTRGAIDFHFNFNRFRPFVGASVGGIYGDTVRDTGAGGVEAGLKFYVHPRTFLFTVGEYQWLFRSATKSDNNFRNGQFLYSLGVGFNF